MFVLILRELAVAWFQAIIMFITLFLFLILLFLFWLIHTFVSLSLSLSLSFTTPQAFWRISAAGALSTPVTSVVLYSLTRATLMSPGKDETRVCRLRVCLSAEGAKKVSWPWLSQLGGWGSLNMTSTGKFVYMAHHFILLQLYAFGLRVDRERWWCEHFMS